MNTRRYPRTMAEAFGPYTSNEITPMRCLASERSHQWATRVYAVILVVTIALTILVGVPS